MSLEFQILYFSHTSSTQEIAKNLLRENIVIVAESQSAGKGRFKRHWYSPPGGLWCTIIVKPNLEPQIISLMMGVVITEALKRLGVNVCLKWPNDILFKGKKLGGILGELYKGYFLIGIGINLKNEIPQEIKNIAINLPKITREELLKNILKILNEKIKDNKSEIIEEWKNYNCTLGKKVKIIENVIYEGIAVNINEEGFLIVNTSKGTKKVIAGDVILLG